MPLQIYDLVKLAIERRASDIHLSAGEVPAIRVDGEIKGNVTAVSDAASTLVVSEQARIEGDIRVSHLVVNGAIDFNNLTGFINEPRTFGAQFKAMF